MDFGEDPFARGPQYEEDMAVLQEIERDLGSSYIAERVTPSKSGNSSVLFGQRYTASGDGRDKENLNQQSNTPFGVDEDEEKQIELIQDELSTANKPLKRSRKRKRSSAVGDESDPLDLSDGPDTKRPKTSSHSTSFQLNAAPPSNAMATVPDPDALEYYLHGRPSVNDTSLAVTHDVDGEKLYIYYDSMAQYQRELKRSLSRCGDSNLRVLPENQSIEQLLDEIQNERIAKEILAQNEHYLGSVRKDDAKPAATELWVDKYAPKAITDLLSAEQINREVTSWVKSWDYTVFGHKYRRAEHEGNNKFVHSKAAQSGGAKEPKKKNVYSVGNMFGQSRPKKPKAAFVPKSAKKKRPEVSVLLLSGAPGTGKSTLAHIVAAHCGYRPFEINASSARTGNSLKDLIVNAATMKPMFGDSRPPLIIMDEIDGAESSAVEMVIRIVRDAQKHHAAKEKGRGRRAKRKSGEKIVNRPILCICNNAYCRALRPLRDICTLHKFKPISTRTLCKRLLEICRRECIHTDIRTLSYLATITNNDIRACLHTLQFFKERSGGGTRLSSRLTIETLTSCPVGRKDRTTNIFDVWARILKRKTPKNSGGGGVARAGKKEWAEIQSMIYGLGNDQRLIEGVMANYPKLGYIDPTFAATADTAGWVAFFDALRKRIDSKQQFLLMGYIPFAMIGVHESCATDTFQKLEYPAAAYKHRANHKENKLILDQFLNVEHDQRVRKIQKEDDDVAVVDSLQHAARLGRWFDHKSSVLELVPMLPLLVMTDRRWDDGEFSSEQNRRFKGGGPMDAMMGAAKSNKRHFVSIINTMIECGLNWVPKDPTSPYFELVPPLDRVSAFNFQKQEFRDRARTKQMNHFVRQRVAHQIVLEVMRRNEAGLHKYDRMRGGTAAGDGTATTDSSQPPRDVYDSMSDEIRTLTPFMSAKTNKQRSRVMGNRLFTPMGGGLFGKTKPNNLMTQQSPAIGGNKNFIASHNRKSTIQRFEYKVQYRFVEGYTNAVKRASFVRDWV